MTYIDNLPRGAEIPRDAMIDHIDDTQDAEQLRARQVGESSPVQQPHAFEEATLTGAEIDQQVERVRWLLRREPMLEREN
jgi:hypothetical protein